MKKLMRKQKTKQTERGITLIALVVTIIVLLILAGVSITMLIGENGLLKMATKAVDEYNDTSVKEQQTIEELGWEMDDIVNGDDNEPVPEGKYYSIRNGKEKTYYATLKEAYEASVDNGGKYRGGTIVLEKDITEELTEPIEINKTITIDLKVNTMKINTSIYITKGTLTITGQESDTKIGTIECTIEDDVPFLEMYNDANINVTGSPLLKAIGHVFFTGGENDIEYGTLPGKEYESIGTLNIQGGYIVSTERSTFVLRGNGSVTINNAKVLALNSNKNAILEENVSSSDILIEGNSIIANGAIKAESGSTAAPITMQRFWKSNIKRKYNCNSKFIW